MKVIKKSLGAIKLRRDPGRNYLWWKIFYLPLITLSGPLGGFDVWSNEFICFQGGIKVSAISAFLLHISKDWLIKIAHFFLPKRFQCAIHHLLCLERKLFFAIKDTFDCALFHESPSSKARRATATWGRS